MSSSTLAAGVRHLRGVMALHGRDQETDEQLLHAFISRRDDSAFAALVGRHGPMVMNLCRRVLGQQQDAEDAFQATFLVLARKAALLRDKTALAAFLHGTAYRMSTKAKQSAARRREHEGQAPSRAPVDPVDELSWCEVRTLLDEEISRLPEKYRSVFVLCVLENVSREEAARCLGLKAGTVSSRLTMARKQLAQRLARRGVELTAVLAAMAVAEAPASALPTGLLMATIKAALAAAAGEKLTGIVSASVAELVRSATAAMVGGKAKAIALVLLIVTTSGSLVGWYGRASGPLAATAEPPAAKTDDKRQVARSKPEEAKAVEFRGQVLDPDGKPFAGARLHLVYPPLKEPSIPARATSDAEGRFLFRVAKSDFDRSFKPAPWEEAVVIAAAKGYGLGMHEKRAGKSEPNTVVTLRLAEDDAPLKGRILDLQGKPVAGAVVCVHGLYAPFKGNLAAFIGVLKDKKEYHPHMDDHLFGFDVGWWMDRDMGTLMAPVKTGEDGRFEIKGVGRERLAFLRIKGPTIATLDIYAMTRTGDTIHAPGSRRYEPDAEKWTLYGNGFDHIAALCRPIVGVVRDKGTGKPIPGAVVTSYKRAGNPVHGRTDLRTIADKNSRYCLLGIPKGEGNIIRAGPPENEPYLMATQNIANPPGLEPITADFALKRGVWISGRVLDKITRQPIIQAKVEYAVFADNPHRKEVPELSEEAYLQTRTEDGTFRVVALPGRGLLAARAWSDQYRTGVGADKIKGLRPDGHFVTYPHLVSAHSYQTLVEVNPAVDAKQLTCDLLLDPGHTIKGEVHGPDGKPLTGVRVSGLRSYNGHGLWESQPLKTSAFTVTGLDSDPEQSRLLEFVHVEKNLAGSIAVKSDDKGPLVVKLVPAAALTGRLVTSDGKPAADGELHALYQFIGQPEGRKVDPTVDLSRPVVAPTKTASSASTD